MPNTASRFDFSPHAPSAEAAVIVAVRSRPRRYVPSRVAVAITIAAGLGLAATQAMAQPRWDVSSRDGLVSIFANAASAAEVANALGDATGVSVVVHGEQTTKLSAEIVDVPLEKAIALLAPSHMLVRESAASDAEIVEVVLMMPDPEGGVAGDTQFLPTGEPADGVMPDDISSGAEGALLDADGNLVSDVMVQPDPTGAAQLNIATDLPADNTLPAAAVSADNQGQSQ